MKIDIRKVFDSISWGFVLNAMDAIGFLPKFIAWIKECITTPMFSVNVNGQLEGLICPSYGSFNPAAAQGLCCW